MHRQNLSVTLKNVALTDPSVVVLAEILAYNNTMQSLDLSLNLVTERGAEALADVSVWLLYVCASFYYTHTKYTNNHKTHKIKRKL